MSLKTHTGYRRAAVIIFFFLNCLLAAAPFTYGSSIDKKQPVATGLLSQNHNQPDTEENNPFKGSDDRYEYQYSVRKKKTTHFLNTAAAYTVLSVPADSKPPHYFISSSYPVRPGYYRLLFLYQLF